MRLGRAVGLVDPGTTDREVTARSPDTDPTDGLAVRAGVAGHARSGPGRQGPVTDRGGRGPLARGVTLTIGRRGHAAGRIAPRDPQVRDPPDRGHMDRALRDRGRWIATTAHMDPGHADMTPPAATVRGRPTADGRTAGIAIRTDGPRTAVRRTADRRTDVRPIEAIAILHGHRATSVRRPLGTRRRPCRRRTPWVLTRS